MRQINRQVSLEIKTVTAAKVFLAVALAVGAVVGHVAVTSLSSSAVEEVRSYIVEVFSGKYQRASAFFSVAYLYLRYPLLIAVSGFTAIGMILLPGMMFSLAFSLSFSASCISAAIGEGGMMAAIILLGIRCVFMLPCCWMMAVSAWGSSRSLARIVLGEKRGNGSLFGPGYWQKVLFSAGVLFAGIAAECFWGPRLLQAIPML